nr:ATPase family AAA domain-containing protein FIGL1 [Nicotiana tomentosiformis]XP_009600284.1 ATPase family AAA domain-containing protein FIGL1 [Nicotiana tomentosiformis]XP_033511883.1 ATPase family AAA domain-containing protein FIGL1 [Nicotiana tomentosiformis]
MDTRQRRGLSRSPSASISPQSDNTLTNKGCGVRSYGFPRRGVRGNFVPPIRGSSGNNVGNVSSRNAGKGEDTLDDSTRRCLEMLVGPDGELPEKLRNIEPRLIEHISNEIMYRDPNVRWNDIAGLEHAKKCVTEMVIWPLLRPDIFRGCRSPGRGLLLFGPPGTGKTMIGKAIAGEAKATFFYISASSLTSKWIGEGEKLVRALFGVASCRQPAVIFVDEIDSLLSQRKSEGEHESSRRLKTQFLIEMEGFDTGSEQILLIGATNRPQELDEAARRRLTKRLYVPLPSSEARAWIIKSLLEKDGLFKLSDEDIVSICRLTEGYSGSDMKNLVKDASMGPLREALKQGIEITKLEKEDMRPVNLQDFEDALQEVRPSVSSTELGAYEDWNKQFGSLAI